MKTFAIIALLTFSSLSAHNAFAQQQKSAASVLAAPGGRFVFGDVSATGGPAEYLLDTQTARLWHIVYDKDNNQVLQPVLYLAGDGTKASTPEEADNPKTK